MSQVDVSILMSVYNPKSERHLMEAIDSIRKQSFKNWEMIIYNDGSDEKYRRLLDKFVRNDSRIVRIDSADNLGLGHAMNVCISKAKGRYLARMDSDDYSEISRLEEQCRFLDEHSEYAWVGSNIHLMDEQKIWGDRSYPEVPEDRDFLSYSPYAHPSVMFRREIFDKEKGYIESKRAEDYELFIRLHANGQRGYNIQKPLLRYREDEDSYKRRKFRYQLEEIQIRKTGFQRLGFKASEILYYIYKPVITAAIPNSVLRTLKPILKKETHVERYR